MKIIFREWAKDKKACVMLSIWLVANLITVLIGNQLIIAISNIFGDIANWKANITVLIVLLLVNMVASSMIGYLKTATKEQLFSTLFNHYINKILDADYEMFTKYSVARINTASEFIFKITNMGLSCGSFIIRGFSIIVTLVTMYTIGGLMIVPVIGIYFIGFFIFKRIFKIYSEIDKKNVVLKRTRNQEFENTINGFAEVRSFGMKEHHRESIHFKTNKVRDQLKRKSRTNALLYGSIDIIEGSSLVLVIIFTLKKLVEGLINQAQAMSLVMLVLKLMDPMFLMLDFVDELSDNLNLKDEYDQIVKYPNTTKDGYVEMKRFDYNIQLHDVCFSYDENTKALTNINMTIQKGQKIGICGVSGGGKTTLFKLLNRFYTPDHGSICIDEIPINHITFDSYRKFIGSVHQENTIFPGSIRENIKYGSPDASEEEMIAASRKAHIHDFVTVLENGYDTEVGPKGLKLSGGQKQRIALARLFLRNPEIILLDEATSALDNESETIIQDAIEALEGKTIITIAHRLSTIKNCDVIYVMGNSGIIEHGTHEELVAKKGAYTSMLK